MNPEKPATRLQDGAPQIVVKPRPEVGRTAKATVPQGGLH